MTDSKDDEKFNRAVKNLLRSPPNPHKKDTKEKNDDQGASAKNSPDRRPKPKSKT